jgi:hypothetical protein
MYMEPSAFAVSRTTSIDRVRRGGCGAQTAAKFGVHRVGFSELVFKDDDAARRLQRGAVIDQFTNPRRDP